MNIPEFIQDEILLPRFKRNGVLVVYDLERRFRGGYWPERVRDKCKTDKSLVITGWRISKKSRRNNRTKHGGGGEIVRREHSLRRGKIP